MVRVVPLYGCPDPAVDLVAEPHVVELRDEEPVELELGSLVGQGPHPDDQYPAVLEVGEVSALQ